MERRHPGRGVKKDHQKPYLVSNYFIVPHNFSYELLNIYIYTYYIYCIYYTTRVHASHFSCVQLFATLWTVAHQTLLSIRLSRQEYWSGLPFLSPGGHLDTGIEPASFTSPALAGKFFTTSATWETPLVYYNTIVNTICHIYMYIYTYTIYIYMPPLLFLAIIFVFFLIYF